MKRLTNREAAYPPPKRERRQRGESGWKGGTVSRNRNATRAAASPAPGKKEVRQHDVGKGK